MQTPIDSPAPSGASADLHLLTHEKRDFLRRLRHIAGALLPFLLVAYVFSFNLLPLQDFPDWVYQGTIFREILFHDNTFDGVFALQSYIPPNATSTVVIGLLSTFLDPVIAGKIFLAAAMLVLYSGIVSYLAQLTGRKTVLGHLLAFLLVFNANFWLGNLNFILGLGIALHGFDLLVNRRWMENAVAASALFLAAYLTHFFAYAILLYAVAIWMFIEPERTSYWRLLLINLPSVLLLTWFISSTGGSGATGGLISTILPWDARQHISLFAGLLVPFQRFKGVFEPGLALVIVNYLIAGGLLLLIVLLAVRVFRERRAGLALLIAAPLPLAILFLPLSAAGIVRPGERLVLFFAVNLLAAAIIEFPRMIRPLTYALLPLCVASYFYYLACTSLFNRMVEEHHVPARATLDSLASRGGTDGFLRLRYYGAIRGLQPMPIFTTGLLTYLPLDSVRAR